MDLFNDNKLATELQLFSPADDVLPDLIHLSHKGWVLLNLKLHVIIVENCSLVLFISDEATLVVLLLGVDALNVAEAVRLDLTGPALDDIGLPLHIANLRLPKGFAASNLALGDLLTGESLPLHLALSNNYLVASVGAVRADNGGDGATHLAGCLT